MQLSQKGPRDSGVVFATGNRPHPLHEDADDEECVEVDGREQEEELESQNPESRKLGLCGSRGDLCFRILAAVSAVSKGETQGGGQTEDRVLNS